jgi:hypothetical protein
MFMPHRVAGGPGRDIKLTKTRVTIGKFVASGEEFKIIDHYTEPKAAHMMLEHAWVGTTEFKELINHEGANINASTKWADWASDEEFVGFDAGASARPHVGDNVEDNPAAKASTHRACSRCPPGFLCDEDILSGGGGAIGRVQCRPSL